MAFPLPSSPSPVNWQVLSPPHTPIVICIQSLCTFLQIQLIWNMLLKLFFRLQKLPYRDRLIIQSIVVILFFLPKNILEHGWISKRLYWVKEARHKKSMYWMTVFYKVQEHTKLIYRNKIQNIICHRIFATGFQLEWDKRKFSRVMEVF